MRGRFRRVTGLTFTISGMSFFATSALLFLLAAPEFPEWMAGTWRGEHGGVRMEEHWTNADGGMMLGLHRDIGAKRTSFEFARIAREGESLVFLAQPGGKPATRFTLQSSDRQRIVFENLQHDFPQRVIYWRDGERLCARVEGEGQAAEEWCWAKVR